MLNDSFSSALNKSFSSALNNSYWSTLISSFSCTLNESYQSTLASSFSSTLDESYSSRLKHSMHCTQMPLANPTDAPSLNGCGAFCDVLRPAMIPSDLPSNIPSEPPDEPSISPSYLHSSIPTYFALPSSQPTSMRWKWGTQDGDKGELVELRSCFDTVRNHSLGESRRWLFYLLSWSSCCIGWCNNTITQRQNRRTIFQLISKYLWQATFSVHFLLWYVLCFQCYE